MYFNNGGKFHFLKTVIEIGASKYTIAHVHPILGRDEYTAQMHELSDEVGGSGSTTLLGDVDAGPTSAIAKPDQKDSGFDSTENAMGYIPKILHSTFPNRNLRGCSDNIVVSHDLEGKVAVAGERFTIPDEKP